MNLDPIRDAATEATSLFHALLQSMPDTSAIWSDRGVDDAGLLMPALAGAAAALTVALMLVLYFQTGYRSYRDMIRHGLAAAFGLSLLAFAAYDMRNAALAHLVKASVSPASEFDQRLRETTERARVIAAEMERRSQGLPEAHQG